MKTKKLLSILLALMMMLSVVPMYASAADPIALTEANVVTWPTIEGEIYWGQKLSDGFTVVGGVVTADGTADGTVIPGKFEFINSEYVPITNSEFADLRFIPDNTQEYIGFEVENTTNVIFEVNQVTPVLVDENDVPVASSVATVNARITTSTLTGGAVKNPYTGEVISATWVWVNRRDKVAESGYFTAGCAAGQGYNTIYMDVYVSIAGDAPATKVETPPSFDEGTINYDPNITWGMLALTGGKAVVSETGVEIEGVFTVSDEYKDKTISVGERTLPVIFTPSDPTQGIGCVCQVPITVNKGQMKFVDENGNEIVPEITVPYGTTFGEIHYYLESYVAGDDAVSIGMVGIENANKTLCETGTYTASLINRTDSNYERTEKEFKIIVEAKKLEPTVKYTGGYYVVDSSAVYHVKGTFDVYVNNELIASDVAYNSGKVKWEATENGTYTMKWVYNPVENDNFIINDVTTTMNVIFPNTITYSGLNAYILGANGKSELSETTERKQGSSVTIGCDAPAFAAWVITDAKGNAVDLGIEDLTATEITFVMPDYDIVITTKTELEIAAENCDHICHSDNPLFQILWKVLTFIFRLFDVQQYCDCGNLHYDAPLFG